jgi:hypothetical protein
MTIKHLIAGAVVTVAVTSALVLGGAAGAQATIFPTPTPHGPGSVNKPIYTVPSLPGFHLPKELWTWYGPPVQPKSAIYRNLPTCTTLFPSSFYDDVRNAGYALTTDGAVHATRDSQLLALIPAAHSINCDFVNASTGGHIDITLAISVDDTAVSSRLSALGYTAPGGANGWTATFPDGRSEVQDVATGLGGWDLMSSSNHDPFLDNVENQLYANFMALNS